MAMVSHRRGSGPASPEPTASRLGLVAPAATLLRLMARRRGRLFPPSKHSHLTASKQDLAELLWSSARSVRRSAPMGAAASQHVRGPMERVCHTPLPPPLGHPAASPPATPLLAPAAAIILHPARRSPSAASAACPGGQYPRSAAASVRTSRAAPAAAPPQEAAAAQRG